MIAKISLSGKLLSIIGLLIAAMVLLSLLAALQLRATMITDREVKLRNLVEAADGTLRSFAERASRGEIDTAQAQAQALQAIRLARYGEDEYYFIYGKDGQVLLNPAHPEREGRTARESRDANGFAFVDAMLDAAGKGGGFVRYMFPQPGQTAPSPKLAYAHTSPAWGWVLATGIYIDDVDVEFEAALLRLAGVFLLVTLVTAGLGVALSRNIGGGIGRLVEVTRRLAAGDYHVTVPETGRGDEIGRLAEAVEVLRDAALEAETLRARQEAVKHEAEAHRKAELLRVADGFEGSVKQVAETITHASGELENAAARVSSSIDTASHQATRVADAAEQASANVQTVAAAAEELSASIAEISRQVSQSAQISTEAAADAEKTNQLVEGLATTAARIGEVVGLITDIAAQTNLLALNATIEAARAGDAGKGFAVVAGEVKTLANQTARATEEISQQITSVQNATRDAVEAIGTIGGTINRINEITATIAAAVEEQGAATQEISRSVQGAAEGTRTVSTIIVAVSDTVGQTGQAAQEVLAASDQLSERSVDLSRKVDAFVTNIRAA
ncbi:MAG: hypothetical protein RLZZ501_1438 [Pseudomonadota bacterium]